MTSTPPARSWSIVAVVPMLLVLVVVALHGVWTAQSYDGKDYVPEGGVDAANGSIRVDDAWLHAPDGVRSGGHADLRLQLANDSGHGDELTGVSTPVAAQVQLLLHGKPVRRISVESWGARDLEWPPRGTGTGIELVGVTRPLTVGRWFPVTLSFQDSAPITMQVTTGPLGQAER